MGITHENEWVKKGGSFDDAVGGISTISPHGGQMPHLTKDWESFGNARMAADPNVTVTDRLPMADYVRKRSKFKTLSPQILRYVDKCDKQVRSLLKQNTAVHLSTLENYATKVVQNMHGFFDTSAKDP